MNTRAFTLIELLIVVAIIGILAAIAVPNFLNAQIRARVARVQADARSTATALESYRIDNNSYPIDATNRFPIGLNMLTTPVAYIGQPPADPFVIAHKDLSGQDLVGPYLEMGTDTPSDQFGEAPRRLGTWSLSGAGPDGDDDVTGQTGWPFGTRWWDYDPSNGLDSNGDMMIIGGNHASGSYIRNGKPNR